jgi:hypothetical protein
MEFIVTAVILLAAVTGGIWLESRMPDPRKRRHADFPESWRAATDAGGTPELLAPEAGQVQAFQWQA